MKVFFYRRPDLGMAFLRIEHYFKLFAPKLFRWVGDINNADLAIVNIVGMEDIYYTLNLQIPYVIVFHCPLPDTNAIQEAFSRAVAIYSFLDLSNFKGNIMRGGWGVDPTLFYVEPFMEKQFTILATGMVAHTEALGEIYQACVRIGGRMLHAGPDVSHQIRHLNPQYYYQQYFYDPNLLRLAYNSAKFVSGLRRDTGFELPVLEGLLCGCRPICFDFEVYRYYFNDFAIFIKQTGATFTYTDFEDITQQLVDVFQNKYTPVTKEEIEEAKKRFAWEVIVQKFWNFILQSL